jgi:hypothetical protein
MHPLSVRVPDLRPDLTPYRFCFTSAERRVLAAWTGKLLVAGGLIPGGTIGDVAVVVYPGVLPATARWMTIKRAAPVVLFSVRALCELTRPDSVLPWASICNPCGCRQGPQCPHFRGAKVELHGCDRTVIYDLVHDLPADAEGKANSDAIAGRRSSLLAAPGKDRATGHDRRAGGRPQCLTAACLARRNNG